MVKLDDHSLKLSNNYVHNNHNELIEHYFKSRQICNKR